MVFVCLCIVNVIIVWRFYPEVSNTRLSFRTVALRPSARD